MGRIRFPGPYGWREIDRETFMRVLERLRAFESMPWREILLDAKKENHTIQAEDLSPDAQRCLEEDWQGADEVVSLRITQMERVLGIMDRGAFTVLWWDPDHEACPGKGR